MKANVLYAIGDIRYTEVPDPEPRKGEVLVRVSCAGICGSDIPRIYQGGAHVMPLIPGHEFSGVVEKTGADVDTKWLGKRVGVFPLIPCGVCGPCRQKNYELCRHYNYLGSRCDGGFAELVRVPASNLMEIPDSVSMEAAAMMEPMSVAMHAIRRAVPDFGTEGFTPDPTLRIVVIGLGTIGLLLTELLYGVGYRQILAVGKKQFQRETAHRMGIPSENILYPDAETVGRILDGTEGIGADIVFECVGRNETAVQAVNAAAPLGRVVLVGNPYSDMRIPRDVYWKILRNQLTVTGTWNSSFIGDSRDDWHCVLKLARRGVIQPETLVTQRFRMRDLQKGLLIMKDKKEEYVKIMVHNQYWI
ncbi:galactitol-1-phosphate 5-dehydrogenase [Bilifractor sp. LCP21S3_A7]|uniref:galactitol-1-phosphate 5-dehydrogenase n=1 Tax=Bilifractor sp. LCP21S3_A7 TaxID=3438738 RepID=UPI003F922A48